MEATKTAITRPIPILQYTTVDPRPGQAPFAVDAALFGDHLDALVSRNYVPITLENLLTAITIDAPVPTRSIVVTFDQGLNGFSEYALPALRWRGFPSTLFVTTGFVGRESRVMPGSTVNERTAMSWSQLRDLADEDVGVGSNGHSYQPLDVMSRWEAAEDLALSRSLLEHQLQRSVSTLAYPMGYHSAVTKEAAARVGYRGAVTLRGSASSNDADVLALSRIPVTGLVRPEVLLAHLRMASRRIPRQAELLRTKLQRTARRVAALAGSGSAHVRADSTQPRGTDGTTRRSH